MTNMSRNSLKSSGNMMVMILKISKLVSVLLRLLILRMVFLSTLTTVKEETLLESMIRMCWKTATKTITTPATIRELSKRTMSREISISKTERTTK
jgi:hypothetical protein